MSAQDTSAQLSLVIPIFNEVNAVEETITKAKAFLATFEDSWELILVDDGSTDGTTEKLSSFEGSENVRVLKHRKNMGYGAALKTGIRASQSPWIAITDSDLTYPIEDLKRLYFRAKQGFAMVVGSRTGDNVQIPWLRRFPKAFLRKLASYLANYEIPDLNSGFRVFRRKSLIPHLALMPNSFSFTSTITLVFLTQGDDVDYLPIDYLGRVGSSKIRPIHDTLLFFQLIIRTVVLFQPLRVFIPLAVLCELISITIVGYFWSQNALDLTPDTTVAIFAVSGMLLFAIGLLADLISRRMLHLHGLIVHDLNR